MRSRPPLVVAVAWLLGVPVADAASRMNDQVATDAAVETSLRRSISARWTDAPPTLEGRIDEGEWGPAEVTGELVQSEPVEGDPLTEPTLIRVLYDRDYLYIGVRCFDSEPTRILVNELVRDFNSRQGDAFGVSIDPFLDRRNAFTFFTNPGGAQRDSQTFADGRYVNIEWDGIWYVAAAIDADGWTAELAIPFKTLGVRTASVDTMGINFKRRIRRKNEEGYWSFVPRRFTISYMSNAGDLTGLGEVTGGGDLRITPFVTGDARFGEAPAADDRFSPKAGVDAKYRIGEGMALDVTYNTDFSQVEADQQQINLTRFSLFFPEKRDFFLENAGIFTLGDVPQQRSIRRRNEETQLFYSRRIGLSPEGEPLPLLGGVRLSGRAGPYSIGLMNIQQRSSGEFESNNFTIARVRREMLSQADAGAMLIYRKGGREGDYNLSFGADFNSRFFDRLTVNAYAAGTRTPGVASPRHAAQVSVEYIDTFFDALLLAADYGEGFDPQVGFVPRTGVRNYQANFGVTPRPQGWALVRELKPHMNIKLFYDRDGRTLTRNEHYALTTSFHDGGEVEVSANPIFDRLLEPFELPNGVEVPVGEYSFDEYRLRYSSDQSRPVAGSLRVTHGGYYGGRRTSVSASATLLVKPRFQASVTYGYNRVRVPAGEFRGDLYGLRTTYSFSPNALVDAYVQHNTSTKLTLANLRFIYTYRPLSDIIIVYNDTRGELGRDSWGALVFKITRLVQF